ncbi:NAD(P)-dependent oxidoreductase [Noviherbaspirillum sp. Root189]|uniref:NAD(P)-dependent oxidoreductase n=1 Tax=Noviherbaspirillum sp. Root189 TaxID=1736487 RepID=UPI000708C59C|nr:NAD(P)-dependent oxidoreductase [Noviherbaspirillum sp. Root189]KRB94213.1 3-beta hydroxysteroid dehydrogenase [Noviherbaspirillum sp. Root189]
MQIALIGASGFIGSALRKEALSRGHGVTALVQHPEKLAADDHGKGRLQAVKADVLDPALAAQLKGHDAVISAFSGHAKSDIYDYYLRGMRAIIRATQEAGVPRLLVVGGAGSLEVAPGLQVVDTPEFPAQWKATAEGAREALKLLRQQTHLDWTMLSPSAHIAPGQRTGNFRLGTDQLLVDKSGESHISLEDYAVAMIDELEKPAHPRQRFTVGY